MYEENGGKVGNIVYTTDWSENNGTDLDVEWGNIIINRFERDCC